MGFPQPLQRQCREHSSRKWWGGKGLKEVDFNLYFSPVSNLLPPPNINSLTRVMMSITVVLNQAPWKLTSNPFLELLEIPFWGVKATRTSIPVICLPHGNQGGLHGSGMVELPPLYRTESLNEAVISGWGSPLVKQARESTSNDLTKSRGATRVAPSAKVGGSPRSHPEQRSEAVHLSVSSSYLSVLNCLSKPQFSVCAHGHLMP